MRSFRALPISRPPPSLSVSQYMRILSRYLPPRSCHTGTPHALPAMSHRATSIPQTPPAWRESPPNCFILLKIFSTLQGFSPSMRLLSIAAYVLLDASRTSPYPTIPWFVYIFMRVQRLGAPSMSAKRMSVIFSVEGSIFINIVFRRFSPKRILRQAMPSCKIVNC